MRRSVGLGSVARAGLLAWLAAVGLSLVARDASAQAAETVVVEQRGEVTGARLYASTATDPFRKRTLLFGGFTNGGIRNDTLEWDGIGWTRRTPSVVPSARYSAGMVYETKHRRVLLFGGIEAHRGGSGFVLADNRTWEWSGGDWRVLSTPNSPTPRGTPAMAVDPSSGDVWMFGGGTETQVLDELYRFDGTAWTSIPKTGAWPPARAAASLGFDPVSKKLVLFGGVASFAVNASGNPETGMPFVDTWTWDGSAWTQVPAVDAPAARPPVRLGADSVPLTGRSSLVTDETRGVLVLIQEAIEGVQAWRYDPAVPTWKLDFAPFDDTSPNLRFFATAFWDAARSDVHLTGGLATKLPNGKDPLEIVSGAYGEVLDGSMANDEWAFAGASWKRWQPAREPAARRDATIAFHEGIGAGVLFGGGFGSSNVLGDNWIWDGGRWYEGTRVDGTIGPRPSARMRHAAAYDPERLVSGQRGAVVLFGGIDADGEMLGDTWIWRDGWTQLTMPAAGAPRARSRHVLARVPGGIVLYGGTNEKTQASYGETWFLGSAATAWVNLDTRIPESSALCATSYGADAYVYGGALRGGGVLDTIFQKLDASRTWSPIVMPTDNPERRSECTLVADPALGQLVLAGGRGPGESKPNWYRYDLAARGWSPLVLVPHDPLGDVPGRLVGAAAFYDPLDRAVTIHGGERRDLEIVVGETWRIRTVGTACDAGQACAEGLTCVDGACCEASACGPCESCAMPGSRGLCAARGTVDSVPGCAAEDGFACNAEGRCRAREGSACVDGAQCASGSCAAGICCPAEGCAARCVDEGTQKNRDGTETECGAYVCKGTACLSSCSNTFDCSAGNECSPQLQCVPAQAATGDDSGCSCSTPRRPGGGAAAFALLCILAAAARVRRRY